ncbi:MULTISPECIES: hypothetical protein [unclassified Rhizobium]|uniref:hypothetical protein n=1 Tax=unclassified Rhizobium TaxID=2613769 RepID=UPI000F735A9B|nr:MULTISPECIES: hypothetical protein [unclassified Rhizobium]
MFHVAMLQAGGPECGWFYDMGTYAIISNSDAWCVYCERHNEIAVIGLDQNLIANDRDQLQRFSAQPIELKIRSGTFPFDRLTHAWQEKLLQNYRTS